MVTRETIFLEAAASLTVIAFMPIGLSYMTACDMWAGWWRGCARGRGM